MVVLDSNGFGLGHSLHFLRRAIEFVCILLIAFLAQEVEVGGTCEEYQEKQELPPVDSSL